MNSRTKLLEDAIQNLHDAKMNAINKTASTQKLFVVLETIGLIVMIVSVIKII